MNSAGGSPANSPGRVGSNASRERFDQRGQAVRVIGQPEVRGHIGGAAGPGLVPSDDRELVGQGELRLPDPAILGSAVHEHERWPRADALVGNLEPVRADDFHRRTVPPRGNTARAEKRARSGLRTSAVSC